MLTKDQLARIAQQNNIGLGTQEKDYLEYVYLSLLYRDGGGFIFKGGTALRIAYNFPRYSEDLDFNAELSARKVKEILTQKTSQLGNFGITAEFRNVETFRENGFRSLTGDISYQGPLYIGKSTSKGKVKVDVSLRGEEVATRSAVIKPPYPDVTQFIMTVLTLGEIFAEKVRALIMRTKPRDLFDVWLLLNQENLQIDRKQINKKLVLYDKQFDPTEIKAKKPEVQQRWEDDLRLLMPQLPPFQQVWDEVNASLVHI